MLSYFTFNTQSDLYATLTTIGNASADLCFASLRPGDSGAALVNPRGAVVGVAFAISVSTADTAYALSTDELRPVLAANTGQGVDTGDCLL